MYSGLLLDVFNYCFDFVAVQMLPMIDDQLDDDRRHQLSQAQQQLHRQNPPQIPLTAQAQHANQALFLQQVARQQQTLYGGMPLQTIPPPASILQDINSQKALQKSSSKSRIRTHQVWTQQLVRLLCRCAVPNIV